MPVKKRPETLFPPTLNKAAKLRQEKIAKRIAANGSKPKEVDIEAIRARRARLEELTKAMRTPRNDKRTTSMMPSPPNSNNVKLTPLSKASTPTIKKEKKKREGVKRKKAKSRHFSTSRSPRRHEKKRPHDPAFEEKLIKEWEKKRQMGDDIRRSSLKTPELYGADFGAGFDDHLPSSAPAKVFTPHPRKSHRQKQDEFDKEEGKDEEEEEDNEENDQDEENNKKGKEEQKKEETKEIRSGRMNTRDSVKFKYENTIVEEPSEKNIKEIVGQLKGETEDERLDGAYRARKQLSAEINPPIDSYIKSGAIRPLVASLSNYNPNLQFEAAWALTNIASGTTENAMAVYEGGAIPEFIHLLSSPYNRVSDQCVWALGNLAGDSPFLWQAVIDEGVIKPLHKLIEKSPSLPSLRNISWAFSNILRHKPLNLSFSDFNLCLRAVRLFLHHPDKEIHLNACWSLVYITDNGSEKIGEVLKLGLLHRLIEDLNTSDKKSVTPAIRALGNIMTGTDKQTNQVIEAGIIPVLVRHIDHSSSNIRKDCAWALSNITAGTEEQIQKVIDDDALPKLARIIEKDDVRVRKEAIWCVSNLTQSGSAEQVDEAIKQGLLESLAKNISPKSDSSADKLMLHVTLEGINNMLEKCSNKKEANETLLKTLRRKDIESLTFDEDKAVKSAAAKIQLLLSEDEGD